MAPQPKSSDPLQQVNVVLRLLEGKKFSRESPVYKSSLEWLAWATSVLQDAGLVERLLTATCEAFSMQRSEIYSLISGVEYRGVLLRVNGNGVLPITSKGSDAVLRSLLPKGGWFEWYDEFTAQTEAPLSYHIFSSLCVLGAAMGRKVFVRMGFFEIFPNACTVLIGPTGRVRKTSAANIAKGLIASNALCPIMADAITPEALATALTRDGGHQFVYAPEFSVLFNRQRYNEALTTRIIRLLDCPQTFEVETVARGKELINDIALTFLGCSTPSLFSGATPDMVTSSGFLNRFMLIVEDDTDREFRIPQKGERRLEIKLEETIKFVKKLTGEMVLSPQADKLFEGWYHERKKLVREISDEIQAESVERGSDHLLRLAMLTHVSHCRDATICEKCFSVAVGMLRFVERNIPTIVGSIRRTQRDEEQERVLVTLRRSGGVLSHSDLLRKSRLDAATFKRVATTLIEGHLISEKTQGKLHVYVLQELQGD